MRTNHEVASLGDAQRAWERVANDARKEIYDDDFGANGTRFAAHHNSSRR